MQTIFIILSVLFAMVIVALWMAIRTLKEKNLRIERELSRANIENGDKSAQLTKAQIDLQTAMVRLEAAHQSEARAREVAKEREAEQLKRETQLREQFKNIATEIFTDHSRQFKESSRESIDTMLKPFKENITSFRDRVETIYNFENEQRGALKNELERLMELNRRITAETSNLTNALRGNSKVQGDWGEMILETILQSSNLVRGTHYSTQTNFKDEAGNNLRPDVLLNLPEGKQIIIDSKTSLTAFVNYVNSEDPAARRQALDAHIVSVRQHIKELANKEYQKLVNSPDFVIMFIPSEPAFLAALQAESSLWSEAYEKRVIISSPTNLFALLKLVDDLWKRNAQSKNTAEIVTRGTKLYDQLVNFVTSLEGVGAALDSAKTKYDDAYKRLCTGNDNIIRNGEKLRKLGLPTKKQQSPKALIDNDMEDDE
ncbi:MAG: DNA recombination protein RmuC [Rikenellaceae bacterium]